MLSGCRVRIPIVCGQYSINFFEPVRKCIIWAWAVGRRQNLEHLMALQSILSKLLYNVVAYINKNSIPTHLRTPFFLRFLCHCPNLIRGRRIAIRVTNVPTKQNFESQRTFRQMLVRLPNKIDSVVCVDYCLTK